MDRIAIEVFGETHRADLVSLWERCDLVRPWNDPGRDVDRKIAVGDGLLLVATRGGSVIGSVMAGYDGHRGWVNYLAVDPAAWGYGLGTRLMRTAEDELRALGCAKINLQIRDTNLGAIAFYEALEYREDHVVSMGKRLVDDTPPATATPGGADPVPAP